MTARLAPSLLCTLGLAAACERAAQPGRTTPAAEAPAADAHEEEKNAIHLGEDMVRDLRISTAPVTERTGAQQVSVLGQLAADESRYAQVAPPTDGQVLQVLAELNAQVRPGTPLARLRSAELGRARADRLTADARRDLARADCWSASARSRPSASSRRARCRRPRRRSAPPMPRRVRRRRGCARSASPRPRTPTTRRRSCSGRRSPAASSIARRPRPARRTGRRRCSRWPISRACGWWRRRSSATRCTVEAGTVAHITMAALPGREFDGRVTQVGRQVDAGSRTDPGAHRARQRRRRAAPGHVGDARGLEVAGRSQTILAVPAAALQRVGQQWLVFVPRTPQEFEMRPVGRGRDLGNEVEVVSGLKAGETVVVEGAFLLKAEAEKRARRRRRARSLRRSMTSD